MSRTANRSYWSRTLALTAVLLAAWLLVNLLVPWFARGLDNLQAFGFPASYWLAAQGLLLLYLLIIVAYVFGMNRLEAGYDPAPAGGSDSASDSTSDTVPRGPA